MDREQTDRNLGQNVLVMICAALLIVCVTSRRRGLIVPEDFSSALLAPDDFSSAPDFMVPPA